MTVGAMPAALARGGVAAAGLAAWLLFRLKVRPPRVEVPSLLLWRRVFDETRELSWWERVRRAVSLVATVIFAALLGLAVTRPAPSAGPAPLGRPLIVLVSSWTMAARTSTGEPRWARPVPPARRLAAAGVARLQDVAGSAGIVPGLARRAPQRGVGAQRGDQVHGAA
jgi:hypothetical protein